MKRPACVLLAAFGVVSLAAPAVLRPHRMIMWNASASVPVGLYLLEATDARYVSELVAVVPPEPLASFLAAGDYLPRGVLMLKRVLALPGQTVCRDGLVITIDKVAAGMARERDRRGRLLPIWQGCRVVAQDALFLMNSRSADSLDGRYFGPLPRSAVTGRAHPVWTKEE